MDNLSREEQIAFNNYFARHFSAEHKADMRDEAIENEMIDLLSIGGECYPFSTDNLFEALGQISDSKQSVISAFFGAANDADGENDFANHGVYISIKTMAVEYWQDVAKTIATRNVDARLS